MATPQPGLLRRADLRAALAVVSDMAATLDDADALARCGIDHVIALPLQADGGWLVGFVLNRRGRDFSDRELALLDSVREPLARLFAHTHTLDRLRGAWRHPPDALPALSTALPLSAREREVLQWVAAGKTDRDVAAILAISPRTVHKHLQRVYDKLGVETRTAAVMRALAAA